MGLIKEDGTIIKGVQITPAYAKIIKVNIDKSGIATSYFGISNSRENLEDNNGLQEISFVCPINKQEDKIFSEIYTKSKENLFVDWQDDIQ